MMNQEEKDNNESEETAPAPDPPEATAEASEDMQVEPAPPTTVEEQPDPNNNSEIAKGQEEQEEVQPVKASEEIKTEGETAVKAEEPSSPAPPSGDSAMAVNISLPTTTTPSAPSAAPPAPSTPPTAAPDASADATAPSTETAALPSANESATSTSPTPTSPTAAAAPLVNDPDYIETPTDRDILSGRGKFVNYHPGNVVFRQLVLKHKVAYVSCPKPQKSGFAEQIVAELAERGARFLKQRAANSNGTGGGWYEIDKKAALLKTRQALREGAPELSEQLTGKSRYEQVTGMPPGGAAPAAPTAPPGLLNPMMPLAAGGSVVLGASAMAAAAGQPNPGGKAGGGLRPDASPNPGGEGSKSPVLGATLPPGAVPPLHYPPALHTLPHPPMAAAAAAALGQTTPFGLMPPGLMYPGAAAAMPNPYADPAMAAMMMQNAAAMQGMMAGTTNPGAMMPMPGMMYPPGAGMMPNAAAAMAAGPYSALMAQQQAQQQQLGQLPQPMNLPTPGAVGDTGTTASGDGSAVAKDPTAPEPLPNTMVQPPQQQPPQDNPDPAAMGGDAAAGASSAGLTEDGGTLTV